MKRRSAGLSRVRAGGALAMLISALAIYGAVASSVFAYRQLDLSGERFTTESAVRAALAISDGTNLVALATDELRQRLEALPAVSRAVISIGLPDTVAVRLVEREPILVWAVDGRRLLVDVAGAAFAEVPGGTTDGAIVAALLDVPMIVDQRTAAARLSVGSALDPIDFDVARRLGSLRPADVGSTAPQLGVLVSDDDGWTVRPSATGWSAVFGMYTPTIRRSDLIPGQVRLLRSLLAGRESAIGRVVLASDTEGTYLPRASGQPSSSGRTAPTPAPISPPPSTAP